MPHAVQGDVVLVAEEFQDGWMRGLKLSNLQVELEGVAESAKHTFYKCSVKPQIILYNLYMVKLYIDTYFIQNQLVVHQADYCDVI